MEDEQTRDLWVNNDVEVYKWHKKLFHSIAYCGVWVNSVVPTYSIKRRSNIHTDSLCKTCVRMIDKERGV